jgi:hypothetical protein
MARTVPFARMPPARASCASALTLVPWHEWIMYVQIQTGYNTDRGPAWISRVRFSKTWRTAYWRSRTLARGQAFDSNFYDVDTREEF